MLNIEGCVLIGEYVSVCVTIYCTVTHDVRRVERAARCGKVIPKCWCLGRLKIRSVFVVSKVRTEEKERRDEDPERGDEERARRYRERKVRGLPQEGLPHVCALLVGAVWESVTQGSRSEEGLPFPCTYMLFSFQEKYMVLLRNGEDSDKP